jgi:hypothetical protein
MKPLQRHSRLKQRPFEVEIDFLIHVDTELVFLSKDLEIEFVGQNHVAVSRSSAREGGWMIFKLGKWDDHESKLVGRRIVISGAGDDFQKRFSGKLLLQSVTPAPLDTVVMKVSDQDYDAVAEDQEIFQQLKTNAIVLRAGKTISISDALQLEVTLCEPVQQGILGDETEVILVSDTDHKDLNVNGLGTPFSTTSQTDSNSDFDISQFLSLPSSEEDLDQETSITEEKTLVPPEDVPCSRGIPLRVHVLETPVDKFSIDPRPTDSEDDEFRVYGNMRDIARIGVFSGDWVSSLINLLMAGFTTSTTIRI